MKRIERVILSLAVAMSLLTFSTISFAQLGSLSSDLVFTPVTPCRILDTREPGGNTGKLVADVARSYLGFVASSFAVQGGSATNCNMVADTKTAAIVVNFTVVYPATAGYITVFPANTSAPLAATLNFNAGDIVGNNATLKLNQTAGEYQFKVYSTSQTHLVADVVGYYAMPTRTAPECYTTAQVFGAINAPAGGRFVGLAIAPACNSGYAAAGTSCAGTSALSNLSSVVNSVCYANHSTNTESIAARQRCCRTPGR